MILRVLMRSCVAAYFLKKSQPKAVITLNKSPNHLRLFLDITGQYKVYIRGERSSDRHSDVYVLYSLNGPRPEGGCYGTVTKSVNSILVLNYSCVYIIFSFFLISLLVR